MQLRRRKGGGVRPFTRPKLEQLVAKELLSPSDSLHDVCRIEIQHVTVETIWPEAREQLFVRLVEVADGNEFHGERDVLLDALQSDVHAAHTALLGGNKQSHVLERCRIA